MSDDPDTPGMLALACLILILILLATGVRT